MGRRSRKGESEAVLGGLFLVGCAALAAGAIMPALVVAAWMLCELYVGLVHRPGDGCLVAASPAEIVAAIERQERLDSAEKHLRSLHRRSHGLARRANGQLDERYRGARALNYDIDVAQTEALRAGLAADEIRAKPLRPWTEWARPFRHLWSLRLGAATTALLTLVSIRKEWWNPAAFVSTCLVSPMPDVTFPMVAAVVANVTATVVTWNIGWSLGARMAAEKLQRYQPAHARAGLPVVATLAGVIGIAAPAVCVSVAASTLSGTSESVSHSTAVSAPQLPPLEVATPSATSVAVQPRPKRKHRKKVCVPAGLGKP